MWVHTVMTMWEGMHLSLSVGMLNEVVRFLFWDFCRVTLNLDMIVGEIVGSRMNFAHFCTDGNVSSFFGLIGRFLVDSGKFRLS